MSELEETSATTRDLSGIGAESKSMVTRRWITIFWPRCFKFQIQIIAWQSLQGDIYGTENNDNSRDS